MEQFYKDIVDTIPAALLLVDGSSFIVLANQSFYAQWGKSRAEVEGKNLSEVLPYWELHDRLQEVQLRNETKEAELYWGPQRLATRVFKATLIPLRSSGDGRPRSGVGRFLNGLISGREKEKEKKKEQGSFALVILQDMSEKITLEQQLIQSEKMAGMGQLAASIAHELGNPLSIMSSTLQFLQKELDKTNDSRAQEIEVIMENIDRMDQLLRSLSDFRGPEKFHFEHGDVHQTINAVIAFMAKEAEGRKVSMETRFSESIPQCCLDHGQLKQVLLNLLKNAFEAMASGGRVIIETGLSLPGSIYVKVSDTGTGIPEGELRHIFKPFYTTKPKGSGLGLAFCRRIIEGHGGKITVESREGGGTTFTITMRTGLSEGYRE